MVVLFFGVSLLEIYYDFGDFILFFYLISLDYIGVVECWLIINIFEGEYISVMCYIFTVLRDLFICINKSLFF